MSIVTKSSDGVTPRTERIGRPLLHATGRVLTAHLHSNHSANSGAGRARYTDDHESLDAGNVPVHEALRLLSGSGANLVIEAKKEALKNGIYLHTLLTEER